MDASGRDLTTGRPPRGTGRPSPAAALADAPVTTWPMAVVCDDGRRLGLAGALGPGGERVQALLEKVAAGPVRAGGGDIDLERLARATPAGRVGLPLRVVALSAAVEASSRVDPDWLAGVERSRSDARRALVGDGRRVGEMEAALHVAVLLATERLDPADDADVDAHVASGAQLWLLAGAVVSALSGAEPDPFGPWALLVAAGWWPVGPSGGRLVVSATGRPAPPALVPPPSPSR